MAGAGSAGLGSTGAGSIGKNAGRRRTWTKMALVVASWVGLVGLGILVVWLLWLFNLGPFQGGADGSTWVGYYTGEDFGIERVVSETDFDGDGVDDYTEFLNGARKDVENHPRYDGSYVQGGFPAEDIGVCTDVIWRAFREAGYDLREMVDADIAARPEAYYWIEKRDKNIDFRRVNVLTEYFAAHAEELTTDTTKIEEWQPGDIAIFENGNHIGMVSDRRNAEGRVYIIHNGGQPNREEDYMKREAPIRHFRFRGGDGVKWGGA